MWRVNNVKDLAGQKFGRLLAVKQNGRDKSGRILWLCACECGAEKTVRGTHLSSGATTSCGCLRRAIASAVATKHGHAKGGKHPVRTTLGCGCLTVAAIQKIYGMTVMAGEA